MRYALVDGKKSEAYPRAQGYCQGCGRSLIPHCGRHKVWHWQHPPSENCDPWAEVETEWHRKWKDFYPVSWQEVPLRDSSGELHIADVRTPHGLVIEFQRSTIKPEEVEARERFYRRMIWVIDGSRNEFDKFNFSNSRSTIGGGGVVSFLWFGRSTLFSRWHRLKPVFIDFGEDHGFWRILRYDPKSRKGVAGLVSPSGFVELSSSGTTDFSSAGGPASL